ncbi:thrombospondin type-1 domain-containing protein [Candidatus Thiodiazotropha endoloripes]|uniref:thrombospondin type-1 domain-containing protein n=1 Tax=Candidatus Thiodiazotropha endoloripes TaxID=1818881 RepID=UPI0011127B59|nr:thrombospondin type-1 domain-containing protein [Candidatus Thiodiazotropha endoloripes]
MGKYLKFLSFSIPLILFSVILVTACTEEDPEIEADNKNCNPDLGEGLAVYLHHEEPKNTKRCTQSNFFDDISALSTSDLDLSDRSLTLDFYDLAIAHGTSTSGDFIDVVIEGLCDGEIKPMVYGENGPSERVDCKNRFLSGISTTIDANTGHQYLSITTTGSSYQSRVENQRRHGDRYKLKSKRRLGEGLYRWVSYLPARNTRQSLPSEDECLSSAGSDCDADRHSPLSNMQAASIGMFLYMGHGYTVSDPFEEIDFECLPGEDDVRNIVFDEIDSSLNEDDFYLCLLTLQSHSEHTYPQQAFWAPVSPGRHQFDIVIKQIDEDVHFLWQIDNVPMATGKMAKRDFPDSTLSEIFHSYISVEELWWSASSVVSKETRGLFDTFSYTPFAGNEHFYFSVDGGWGDWIYSEWQPIGCTNCIQQRTLTRICNDPEPQYGGEECRRYNGTRTSPFDRIDVINQTREIGVVPDIVDGGWSDWSYTQWEEPPNCIDCQETRIATRTCTEPVPLNGGTECLRQDGSRTSITNRSESVVETRDVPRDGGWSEWSYTNWSPDGCTGCTQTRSATRICNSPEPLHGGAECLRENGTLTTPDNRLESITESQEIPATPPEYGIQSYSITPTNAETGERLRARVVIENNGGPGAQTVSISYMISTNSTISTGDTVIGTDETAIIDAGGDDSEIADVYAPSSAGTYYFGICIRNSEMQFTRCSDSIRLTVSEPASQPVEAAFRVYECIISQYGYNLDVAFTNNNYDPARYVGASLRLTNGTVIDLPVRSLTNSTSYSWTDDTQLVSEAIIRTWETMNSDGTMSGSRLNTDWFGCYN